MKNRNPVEEDEIYMLLNHCIERLPNLKDGLIHDCMDELPTTISFESPKFVVTMKLERKKEVKIKRAPDNRQDCGQAKRL